MNYSKLESEILADIDWRVKELTSIVRDSLQHTEDMISDSYSSSIILYRILLSKKMLSWQRRYAKSLLILLRQ